MLNPGIPELLKMTRREWLRMLLFVSAWLPARAIFAAAPGVGDPIPLATLEAFLDTLLPGYGETPSAGTLGTHLQLAKEIRGNESAERIVRLGCAWLNEQAGARNFEHLDEEERITIVSAAENHAQETLPWVFFNAVKTNAFRIYYTDPGIWQQVRFPGPPQPNGFPGHDLPPANS